MRHHALRVGIVALAGAAILAGAPAHASSHREAPGITMMPKVDASDFYMFNSYEPGRSGYVTFIANYAPLQDAYGGPNFFTLDQDATYNIHVDTAGNGTESTHLPVPRPPGVPRTSPCRSAGRWFPCRSSTLGRSAPRRAATRARTSRRAIRSRC